MSDTKTQVMNVEYVMREIKRKDRGFDDIDLTLRLHFVHKYLCQINENELAKSGRFME